jgi:hypothetical protein
MSTLRLSIAAAALLFCLPGFAQTPPSKSYQPGAFDSLQIAGSANVRYHQGDKDEVIVEGDEAVQRQVQLELRGSRLTVRTHSGWLIWTKPRVNLQVTTRELTQLGISGAADFVAAEPVASKELHISISGSGLARFDQLKAGDLRFTVSGAGDGKLAGQVDNLRISISGKGDVQAEHLAAQHAQVGISGVGKARLWAIQELNVSTSGIGTVEYWGSPQVQRRTSGVSSVNGLGAKAAPGSP